MSISPSSKSLVEAFKMMVQSGRTECKDDLLKKVYNSEELFSKDPMQTFDICLELIKIKDYEEADKILDFGFSIFEKNGGNYSQTYLYLNKMQLIKHRGLAFDARQLNGLEKIESKGDFYEKVGALVLLDKITEAEELMTSPNNQGLIDIMITWPIMDFARGKFTDEKLRSMFPEKN